MSEPTKHASSDIRPTEYIAPVLVVLLVVVGSFMYFRTLRARPRQLAPEQRIEIRLPGVGTSPSR